MKRMKKYLFFLSKKLVDCTSLSGLFCALLAKKAGEISRFLRFKQALHLTTSLPGAGASRSISRELIAECLGS